ncbi:hypothetical protein AHIS1_p024 [Acaryochloris phage A-HIS1]|nr:hypothetical protein AHIS1_p024 [Acaryochloris phage A-HIS1]
MILKLRHGLKYYTINTALRSSYYELNDPLRFKNPRYCPLLSEKPHKFYEAWANLPSAIYEYIHYGITDDFRKSNLKYVLKTVSLAHKNHMTALGVPFGSSTLRLMKYPAQSTPKSGSIHLDFDFMTTVVGSMIVGKTDEYEFSYASKTFYGDIAQRHDPKFKALPHNGAYYRNADRYAIVVFTVPPNDFAITDTLTVSQYYELTQAIKY